MIVFTLLSQNEKQDTQALAYLLYDSYTLYGEL